MQDPNFRPPIPTPDGHTALLAPPVYAPGDWQSAPTIVRGWAYPLTWLGIVVQPLLIFALFSAGSVLGKPQTALILLSVCILATQIYLNRTLKKRIPAAWPVQIALSAFIILFQGWAMATGSARSAAGIIGVLIHAYILSQWFKPDVKTWFNRN